MKKNTLKILQVLAVFAVLFAFAACEVEEDKDVSVVFSNVAGDTYVVSQALLAEGDPAFNSQEAVAKYNKLPANTTLTNGQTHKITVKCDKVMSVGAIGVTTGIGGTTNAHFWPADGSTTGKGKTHTFVCDKETTINFGPNGSIAFAAK